MDMPDERGKPMLCIRRYIIVCSKPLLNQVNALAHKAFWPCSHDSFVDLLHFLMIINAQTRAEGIG